MATDLQIAQDQWDRYAYARDAGHLDFVLKAEICERFLAGYPNLQWNPTDLAELQAAKRPALTVNKILSTLSNIWGEQIQSRSEVVFKPVSGAPPGNADTLTKVWKQVADANQLNWVRSDVFADGSVTSRGYYELEMDFDTSPTGAIRIGKLNPKNVLVDPDAYEYDPDTWADVFVTKWMSPDDIAILFDKDAANELAFTESTSDIFGYDSIEGDRDRFGKNTIQGASADVRWSGTRNIRCIYRQHREKARVKFFVDKLSGDMTQVPESWDRDRIAHVAETAGLFVLDRMGKRIRWTVTAANLKLHQDWSPYRHFTVVPYFPYFRHGRTIGLVENLIDPQELLNKVSSQELHIVNTTANSGWKIKKGALANMSIDELEDWGAKTGLVIEVNGSVDDVEKISPNQVPTGIERIGVKAENNIKTISGRGDSQMGMARADAAARAVEENKASGDVTVLTAMDALERSDWLLARAGLAMIQDFYTDHRVLNITHNDLTGDRETIEINSPEGSEDGSLQNDVTLGTYEVKIISQPARRTLEESQFQQGVALMELGVPIPPQFLIENSNLMNKTQIIKAMQAASETPEAQMKQKAELLAHQLNVANLKAEASKTEADAVLKRAKAEKEMANTMQVAAEMSTGQNPELAKAAQEMDMERERMDMERQERAEKMQFEREKHGMEMDAKRESQALDMQLKQQQAAQDMRMRRAQTLLAAKQAASTQPGA